MGWERVGTAFPHVFLAWERVPTPFNDCNVTWRCGIHKIILKHGCDFTDGLATRKFSLLVKSLHSGTKKSGVEILVGECSLYSNCLAQLFWHGVPTPLWKGVGKPLLWKRRTHTSFFSTTLLLSTNHQVSQRVWYVQYHYVHAHMAWSQKFHKSEFRLTPANTVMSPITVLQNNAVTFFLIRASCLT